MPRPRRTSKKPHVMLGKHQIRSRVDGIIRSVAKHPGEIRARPAKRSSRSNRRRRCGSKGTVDIEYEPRLQRNMAVLGGAGHSECSSYDSPRTPAGGRRCGGDGAHEAAADRLRRASTASSSSGTPISAKRTDRPALSHNLPHPVPARAVACTPPGVEGDPRSHRRRRRQGPHLGPDRSRRNCRMNRQYVPSDFHTAAVTGIAVSPDGKYAATAAGREVFIWDIAERQASFTRCRPSTATRSPRWRSHRRRTLVTAGKDRTMKVWKLGAETRRRRADDRPPLRRRSMCSASARTAGGCFSTRTGAESTW